MGSPQLDKTQSSQTSVASALRRLAMPVYLPWVGMSIGLGMLSVVLPLAMVDFGFGYGAISAVLGAVGVGSAIAAVPSGSLVAHLGERRTMVTGLVGVVLSFLGLALSERPVALVALQFAAGASMVAMRIAAQTLITHTVVAEHRGRTLSMMGGIRRFGMFVGPLLGGVSIEWLGFSWSLVICGLLPTVGLLPLLSAQSLRYGVDVVRPSPVSIRRALALHWRKLLAVAAGPVLIMAVRRGRGVVLPLMAEELDVGPVLVGLVVSVGTGADLLLFPLAGYIMDTFGRLRAIVPAFGLMSLGLMLLAGAQGAAEVVVAGVIIGLGNGLSAGSMLTLGSDLAPAESPSQFMAGFAALQDWGMVLGPTLVGVVATAVGLRGAAAMLGMLVLFGVGLIVVTAGETRTPAMAASSNATNGRKT